MRKIIFSSIAFSALTLPAIAMDMGCSPASKLSARAPVEVREQAAEVKATPVTDEMKSETLRTASVPQSDEKTVR